MYAMCGTSVWDLECSARAKQNDFSRKDAKDRLSLRVSVDAYGWSLSAFVGVLEL